MIANAEGRLYQVVGLFDDAADDAAGIPGLVDLEALIRAGRVQMAVIAMQRHAGQLLQALAPVFGNARAQQCARQLRGGVQGPGQRLGGKRRQQRKPRVR